MQDGKTIHEPHKKRKKQVQQINLKVGQLSFQRPEESYICFSRLQETRNKMAGLSSNILTIILNTNGLNNQSKDRH